MVICPSEYPKNRLWDEKVFSMPNIPRGDEGLLFALREILTKVRNHGNPHDLLVFRGSSRLVWFRQSGLVDYQEFSMHAPVPFFAVNWLCGKDKGRILCHRFISGRVQKIRLLFPVLRSYRLMSITDINTFSHSYSSLLTASNP